jgi:hypothetical protein
LKHDLFFFFFFSLYLYFYIHHEGNWKKRVSILICWEIIIPQTQMAPWPSGPRNEAEPNQTLSLKGNQSDTRDTNLDGHDLEGEPDT